MINNNKPIINIQENPNPNLSEFLLRKKEDQPEIVLRKKEEDKPEIILHKITHEKPGFFKRWGSFINFLRHGREMDNKKHLRDQYQVEDKLEIIKRAPVFHITDENAVREEPPSPLHRYYDNELVKDHISGQKSRNGIRNNRFVSPFQETTYNVDDVYSHTTIDQMTRQEKEDFWVDKEVKSYAIIGVTLAIGITSFLIMSTFVAMIVASVATQILYKMVPLANEATQEVHAWRDTMEEQYRCRQEIAMEHIYDHQGMSHLDKNLIGKSFDPQETWKFWLEEWKNHKEIVERNLSEQRFTPQNLHHFFDNNPYESFEKNASIDPKPEHYDKYEKLNGKYTQLQRAYEMLSYNYSPSLIKYEEEEKKYLSTTKKEWTDHLEKTAKQLIGKEPPNIDKDQLEEHEKWSSKKEKIEAIKKYYLEQIEPAFMLREFQFNMWHSSRKKSLESSVNNTLNDLVEPIQAWWNLAKLLDSEKVSEEDWKIDSVDLGKNLKNEQPIDPPKLPEPLPFASILKMPDEKVLEEKKLDPELTTAFIKLF